MSLLINILIGIIIAALVYYIAGLFLPSPLPFIAAAVLVVLVAAYGLPRSGGHPWRY